MIHSQNVRFFCAFEKGILDTKQKGKASRLYDPKKKKKHILDCSKFFSMLYHFHLSLVLMLHMRH